VARGFASKVFHSRNLFIANVTEDRVAVLARKKIIFVFFPIYFSVPRASDAATNINVGVLLKPQIPFDQLGRHLGRLQVSSIVPTMRISFVVLLPFRRLHTRPAEVLVADGALHVGAPTL